MKIDGLNLHNEVLKNIGNPKESSPALDEIFKRNKGNGVTAFSLDMKFP